MITLRPLAFFAFLIPATPAMANLSDLICDDSERLAQQIGGAGGARIAGKGMRSPDALIEVWIEPRTGDWTLVQSYANGTSCILAMGEHWETITVTDDPA